MSNTFKMTLTAAFCAAVLFSGCGDKPVEDETVTNPPDAIISDTSSVPDVPELDISNAEDWEFIEFSPVKEEDSDAAVQTVNLPNVGWSTFLTVDAEKYGIGEDEVQDFLSNELEYASSDQDIVVTYDGRILATGIGTATVTVKYGDLVQKINVVVGTTKDE